MSTLTTLLSAAKAVVQTGYFSSAPSSGAGEDASFVDVTISSVGDISRCLVMFFGGAQRSTFAMTPTTLAADGLNINSTSHSVMARLTSVTNLRISAPSTASTIQGRWYVIKI